MLKLWKESLTDGPNDLKFECPFKKGFYEIVERDYSSLSRSFQFIPSFLKSDVFTVRMRIFMQTKEKNGRMITFYEVLERYKVSIVDEWFPIFSENDQ